MDKSQIVLGQIKNFIDMVTDKVIWFLSLIFTTLLSALGYPKEILIFILTLVLIDIVSKHYSIVVMHYGSFSAKNYIKAWRERKLTSRRMKGGVGVKTILYLPILYIAHKASILPELIYGSVISNVLYSLMVIIESRSILENLEDSGFDKLRPIIKFLGKKEKDIMNSKDGGDAVG